MFYKRDGMHLKLRGVRQLAMKISFLLLWAVLPCSDVSGLTPEEINTIEAYEKVAPSVANITTETCEPEFFYCAIPSISGSGSGVVIGEDGIIVTNSHVVAGARNIFIVLSDGRHLAADVKASSTSEDIAILKVNPGSKPLKAIVLGDSDKLKVGDKVLAVGNPFGLGQTLTAGTVSMTGRTIKDGEKILRDLIQTDASINPGNSGGALVNSDGELVGLCTAILSPTGASIRIGFALPVNRVKQVVPGLMSSWPKVIGWALAIVLVSLFVRRIYRRN